MRTRSTTILFLGATLFLGASGCNTRPGVTVVRSGGESVDGDAVKLRRGGQELYQGSRGGFWVVRDETDWRSAWPSDHVPPYPTELDTSSMLLLATSESKKDVGLRIDKVVESTGTLHVWLKQTKAGSGCKPSLDNPPFDAVVVPRIEKSVKVYVSEDQAESCGEPPVATLKCRVGENPTWTDKPLAAKPGDKIDCEVTGESRGTFAIADRTLSVETLPQGSSAKFAFGGGPTRGVLELDIYGTYVIHGEASDEAGRRGKASLKVDALPEKSRDVVVQLAWANFDASDDPATFPRVSLHAKEPPPRARECTDEHAPAEFCTVQKRGSYTHMTLKAGTGHVPLWVGYVDERIEKGPLVCVQAYFEGAQTAEMCDRVHRDADEKWTVGTLDLSTGKFVDTAGAIDLDATDAGAPAAPASTAVPQAATPSKPSQATSAASPAPTTKAAPSKP